MHRVGHQATVGSRRVGFGLLLGTCVAAISFLGACGQKELPPPAAAPTVSTAPAAPPINATPPEPQPPVSSSPASAPAPMASNPKMAKAPEPKADKKLEASHEDLVHDSFLRRGAAPGALARARPSPPNAAGAGAENRAPAFPWPPPQSSAIDIIPAQLIARAKQPKTLGDVDAILRKALDQSGYVSHSYYSVPGGFSIATRLERFDADGRPANGQSRWQLDNNSPQSFSLSKYIAALFSTDPGHFRVLVFVTTDRPFAATAAAPSRAQAEGWLAGGFNTLPRDVAAQSMNADITCTALVYEFEKPPGGTAMVKRPGSLDADRHLRGSGLLAALGG